MDLPGSSDGKVVKPTVWEIWVQFLGWENLLEKEMTTQSGILAWEIHGWSSRAGYSPWGHNSRTQFTAKAPPAQSCV